MGRLTGLGGALVVVLLTGCGGGGGGNDNPAPAPAPPPPAANTTGVMVDLTSQKVVGGGAPSGSATADFTIDLDDRTITGTVTLNGLTADGVTINGGFAGENGAVIVTMNEDSATQWSVPAGTALLATEFDDFNAGALYVQVTTATEPNGAVRGQLLTGNIEARPAGSVDGFRDRIDDRRPRHRGHRDPRQHIGTGRRGGRPHPSGFGGLER